MENKSKINMVNVFIYSGLILGFACVLVYAIISKSEYMWFQVMASVVVMGWNSFKLLKEVSLGSKTDIEETV